MSEERETHILDQLEQLSKLAPLIRYLIAGAALIATSVLGVGGWVWHTNQRVELHEVRLDRVEPKVISFEHWRASNEATPKVHYQDMFALDKRMQRVEDQTAAVLDTLRRIEDRLK